MARKNDKRQKFNRKAPKREELQKVTKSSRQSGSDLENQAPFNDFEWYNNNPNLTQAAASIPFPYRPGMYLDLGDKTMYNYGSSIPGVMSLEYALSVGRSADVTSPISIAAKEMYGRIRDKFSGTLPEDAPDIMLYIMAMDSVYLCIGEMKRLYRILNAYSPYNYAVPTALVQAATCGFPGGLVATEEFITSLRRDKMKLFQYINELVGMTRKFTVPGNMSIIKRHYWLADNVYTDDPSPASQMYMFVNTYHYKFEIYQDAGSLAPTHWPEPTTSSSYVDLMYDHVRGLIEALANSEDAYTINGHLMRAYEGEPTFTLDYMDLNQEWEPKFIPMVLMQIENALTIPGSIDEDSLRIKQNVGSNALIHKPTFSLSTSATTNKSALLGHIKPMLSIRSEVPSVEMVVEASRLHMAWRETTSSGIYDILCGTEILLHFQMFTPSNSTPSGHAVTLGYPEFESFIVSPVAVTPAASNVPIDKFDLGRISDLSRWMYHPFIYYVTKFATSGTTVDGGKLYVFGDFHNVTTLTPEQVDNINRVCVYSQFNTFKLS
jgi:hypothetical protein